MKRVLLICPDKRPLLEDVTGDIPVVLAIYLGKPLIEHALDGLAQRGATHVLLLASDRPSDLRDYVGNGSAWGLDLQISAEPSELSISAAAERHASFQADTVINLESLPQAPEILLLKDVKSWHLSRVDLLPLLAPHQMGAREISPGVWCGMKANIHPSAVLNAPCWIGKNTQISAEATIGPNAFVENDSVIDAQANVDHSTVSPRTYLGSMMNLGNSIAAGSVLLNWQNESKTRVSDAFLLSRLDPPQQALSSPVGRALALLVIFFSWPLPLLALFSRPWCIQRIAVLPTSTGESSRRVNYYQLPGLPGFLKRWPQLWRIVTGHFSWVGNPPLSPEEVALLDGEFERLWLQAPPGIFTAPEAEGYSAPWDEAARAHAALFAAQQNTAWKWKIIVTSLKNFFN